MATTFDSLATTFDTDTTVFDVAAVVEDSYAGGFNPPTYSDKEKEAERLRLGIIKRKEKVKEIKKQAKAIKVKSVTQDGPSFEQQAQINALAEQQRAIQAQIERDEIAYQAAMIQVAVAARQEQERVAQEQIAIEQAEAQRLALIQAEEQERLQAQMQREMDAQVLAKEEEEVRYIMKILMSRLRH